MSHDLRTPLTSIIGYLKLLQQNTIDKEEALEIIGNKTNKLNVLINDFFEREGIEPKICISNKPIFIMGDKDSLERIIDNLLSNTLKYAEEAIEIKLEECDAKVIFKISNICTGIDEKDEWSYNIKTRRK